MNNRQRNKQMCFIPLSYSQHPTDAINLFFSMPNASRTTRDSCPAAPPLPSACAREWSSPIQNQNTSQLHDLQKARISLIP